MAKRFDPCSCGSGDSTLEQGLAEWSYARFRSLFLWIGRFNSRSVSGAALVRCFDPCSCGSGDSTRRPRRKRRMRSGFDPCSCGSGDSTAIPSLMLSRQGFDPCSCGSGDSTPR